MTETQELFLQYFPGWPVDLFERFDDRLLNAELAYLTQTDRDGWLSAHHYYISQYNGVFDYPLQQGQNTKNFSYYSPTNPTFAKVYNAPADSFLGYAWAGRLIGSEHWGPNDPFLESAAKKWNPKQLIGVSAAATYDTRLYGIDGYGSHKWYSDIGPVIYVKHYDATMVREWTLAVINSTLYYRSHFYTTQQQFAGVASVIAWIENGVTLNTPQITYDFRDFLSAFRTYGAQIIQEKKLAEIQAINKINDFKRELSEKLNTEKNRLESAAYQISNASENDARSAIRDMQALQLNAQNLFLNLQGSINGG